MSKFKGQHFIPLPKYLYQMCQVPYAVNAMHVALAWGLLQPLTLPTPIQKAQPHDEDTIIKKVCYRDTSVLSWQADDKVYGDISEQ